MSLPLSQKKVFLIPYWLKNTLTRNQLPLTAVLSLEKLKECTSTEDLVLTMALNNQTVPVFGAENAFNPTGVLWTNTPAELETYQQLASLLPLHAQGLQDRLFNEQTLDSQYPEAYSIQDIGEEVFLVVIYPGYFGGKQAPLHQNQLVTDLLKLFYGYSNYEVMARDPLFQPYLARL